MEKNNQKALALLACFLVFLIYKTTVWDPYFYGKASQPGKAPEGSAVTATTSAGTSAPAPSPTQPAPSASVPAALPSVQPSRPGQAPAVGNYPTDEQIRSAGEVTIETSSLSLRLSYLGGRVSQLLLKDYALELAPESPRLNLVDHVEGAPLPLGIYDGNVEDTWVQYRLVSAVPGAPAGPLAVAEGSSATFELKGRLPDGREITKKISLEGKGHLVNVDVQLSGPAPQSPRLEVEWTKQIPQDSPSLLDPYDVAGFVWFDGQKASRQQFGKIESAVFDFGSTAWTAMADKYFMAALISQAGSVPSYAIRSGELFRLRMAGEPERGSFRLFAGPKSYELLMSVGNELHRAINFGRTGFISAPLLYLLQFFYGLVGNYGLAIVALTILVKTILYPLNSASFKQMKAMQDLQPEVQHLRDTIKDKQQQQVAMMALYKKRGVNPLGGCLPVLVQMPIFIGLYSALLLATELRHAHFAFWINDLSATERLMVGNIGIPVMVILFVLTMLVQQWTTPSTMDPVQKKVMMVMPIVFGFMFANFPAGLTLYWLTNNLISIGQQKAIQRQGARSALAITAGVSLGVFLLAWVIVLLGQR